MNTDIEKIIEKGEMQRDAFQSALQQLKENVYTEMKKVGKKVLEEGKYTKEDFENMNGMDPLYLDIAQNWKCGTMLRAFQKNIVSYNQHFNLMCFKKPHKGL